MVNYFIVVCIFVYTYYGLINMFSNKISEFLDIIHKKSKRRILYKFIYLILFIVLIPYLIISRIIGGEWIEKDDER